jgi:hypothetical protein
MLVGLIKTAVFIFPFIKELFLGKAVASSSLSAIPFTFLKKLTIAIGCASFVTNLFFINRLYSLAAHNVSLTKQLSETKPITLTPSLPSRPLRPLTPPPQPEPSLPDNQPYVEPERSPAKKKSPSLRVAPHRPLSDVERLYQIDQIH